jgi:hypothetical protein
LIGGTHGADYKSALSSRADVSSIVVEAWALLAFGLFKVRQIVIVIIVIEIAGRTS